MFRELIFRNNKVNSENYDVHENKPELRFEA